MRKPKRAWNGRWWERQAGIFTLFQKSVEEQDVRSGGVTMKLMTESVAVQGYEWSKVFVATFSTGDDGAWGHWGRWGPAESAGRSDTKKKGRPAPVEWGGGCPLQQPAQL